MPSDEVDEPQRDAALVAYWEERGSAASQSEEDAVCYPGAPPRLNRYAGWSQRRAVDALLFEVGPLSGRRVLDVGCGTGRWSRLLAERGADVLGVDRSESMLAEARRRSDVKFRQMDATRLTLSEDAFELAIAVTLIQHLEPPAQERAAAELVRVVRPHGYVLTIDRVGDASAFAAEHGTFPRPREGWHELWRRAGAELVAARGQEFAYPLALARLGRVRGGSRPASSATRRGGRGWRRVVLDALVLGSYASEIVAERIPRAPAAHVAALYVVR